MAIVYPLTIETPPGPAKIPPVKVLTNWLIFIPQFIWLYILHYSHNDPAGAYPNNIFFAHLVPFLDTVAS